MRKVWQSICSVVFALVATVTAAAQHYPILPVAGSPLGIVSMTQDSRSAIWMGTGDNVFCFDGQYFYSLRGYGFPSEKAMSLAGDSDGGMWIATQNGNARDGESSGGVYRYQNGRVEKMLAEPAVEIVRAGPETMLAVVAKKVNWNYADLYLFRKGADGWHATKVFEDDVRFLTVDRQGAALYPCHAGMCELSARQIAEWPKVALASKSSLKSLFKLGVESHRILRDRLGCLWFRNELQLSHTCPGSPTVWSPDAKITVSANSNMTEMDDGAILTTGAELALVRPDGMRIARVGNGLPAEIKAVLPARDGTIFLGTSSGLYRFMHPFGLEYWERQDGVDSPFFVMNAGGRVFASNSGIKVLSLDRTHWQPWASAEAVGTTVHMVPGPDGMIYAASLLRGAELLSRDGRVVAHSVYGPGAARLATDNQGRIWMAARGVYLLQREGSRLDQIKQGMGENVSLDMEYDPARNAIWACQDHDVVILEEKGLTRIGQKDGLLDDACGSIAVLPNGDVWVGYRVLGSLTRIRRSAAGALEIDSYPHDSKAHDGDYSFLDGDSHGWLWWATDGKDYVATGAAAALGNWIPLDAQDGIPVPGGNQNSLSKDVDGSVWFASDNTVVHFSPPDDFATRFPPPPVFIAGLSTSKSGEMLADAMQPIAHSAEVVAHVGSMQFDRRSAMQIRYRLLPKQNGWTYTSDLDLALGKPGWGHHTLEVQAELATGPWSEVAQQPFYVLLPVWLSWPVLLVVAVGGTGAGTGVLRWRRWRRFRRDVKLPDISAWRMGALSPDAEQLIGTVIDVRYEIGHILSVGGFATVTRARDLERGGELCAVKIFRYEVGDRAWIRHRFEQEVAALELLSHPNIVKITGHGAVGSGAPYLVMEFIHGRSLREVLEAGALPRRQTGVFLGQLASALDLLHRSKIFHRDIKPENTIVRSGEDGEEGIVLIDFSIAIVKSPAQTFHGISRVAGTLEYMAPEQVIGYADASTDIYSLAKLTMEMLTGLRWGELFPEATLDLPTKIQEYFAKNPGVLGAESVDHLAAALAFDPERRPKDAVEFARPIVRDLRG